MMLPTHITIGFLFSIIFFYLHPDSLPLLIIATLIGSIIPDIDIFIGQHRKTLHFPVGYTGITVILLPLYFLLPTVGIASLIVLVGSASIHSLTDIIGGGLSKTPWKTIDSPTVYSHYHNVWITEKNAPMTVKYDGSYLDFAVLLGSVYIISQINLEIMYLTEFLILLLVIGGIYTSIRRKLPVIEELLYQYIPLLRPFINTLHGNKLNK
jgi:hypothetical protein